MTGCDLKKNSKQVIVFLEHFPAVMSTSSFMVDSQCLGRYYTATSTNISHFTTYNKGYVKGRLKTFSTIIVEHSVVHLLCKESLLIGIIIAKWVAMCSV